MAENVELPNSSIEFWLEQAKELKKAADICWTLDETVKYETVQAKLQGLATSLLEASGDVDAELKWLYGNLMAFAIQYLSIGILIHKNPQRFLREYPGNRIIELVEECGVVLNSIQVTFLKQVENTFQWSQKFPQWNVSIARDQLAGFKAKHTSGREVTQEEKTALDELFTSLRNLAVDSLTRSKNKPLEKN
ncbi:MAG: hypothetical protein P8Y28_06915 [Gammaproteobacteria bacterium]